MATVLLNEDHGDHLEVVKLALYRQGISIYGGTVTDSWATIQIMGGLTLSQTVFLTQLVLEIENQSLGLQSLESGIHPTAPQAITATFR